MAEPISKQPRFEAEVAAPTFLFSFWEQAASVPPWGSPARERFLREAARSEPILSGAISSLLAKLSATSFTLSGTRNLTRRFFQVLIEAEGGQGWSYFLKRAAFDFFCSDRGCFIELARQEDSPYSPVAAIYNLDSAHVELTGSPQEPYRYYPQVGPRRKRSYVSLYPHDVLRLVDMPGPEEEYFGLGFCAVSRVLRISRILKALYDYEEQRLSDLPLPGIAAITGMTMDEVVEAFKLYEAKRKAKGETVFRGVLWLAAQSSPHLPIKVDFTEFTRLPEGFDRQDAIRLYVYTLALVFGVDVREFWPASQTGATKAEAEIQHQKAKGKGFGALVADLERGINLRILPPGVTFRFHAQDLEDTLLKEQIRARRIENIRRLWEPAPVSGQGLISVEEARQLLAAEGLLPGWLLGAPEAETILTDTDLVPSQKAEGPGEIFVYDPERQTWDHDTYGNFAILVPDWPSAEVSACTRPSRKRPAQA